MDRESLWLRLEPLILDLIKTDEESRNSLGPKLGFSRNHLGRFLRTAEERRADRRVRPDFNLAFQIAEHYGIQPTTLLAPYAHDAPEVLLQILPCEPDHNPDTDLLDAIATLESRVVGNGQRYLELWDERRSGVTELARIYAELEELENRRHYAAHEVAETCRDAILGATNSRLGSFGYLEALRLTGLAGIWASIQRRKTQLFRAREAVRHSLIIARRLGDSSLYANQLQRASYVLRELNTPDLAVLALRESAELYRVDGNEIGAIYTLLDRAALAANCNRLPEAERLYTAGLNLLPREDRSVYRATATQGLATCFDLRGDIEGALALLTESASISDPRDTRLRGLLLWTAANIQRRLGSYSEAEAKYFEVLQIFEDLEFADLILRLALDLSLSLVKSGKYSDLERLRAAVLRFLPRIRKQKTLQFQYELLLRELTAEPSESRLSNLRRQVEARRL